MLGMPEVGELSVITLTLRFTTKQRLCDAREIAYS